MAKLNKISKLHSMVNGMNETQLGYLKDYLTTNSKTPTSKTTLGDNESTALVYYKGITGILQKISSGKYYLLSCNEKNCDVYYIADNEISSDVESCSLLEVFFELIESEEFPGDAWVQEMKERIIWNEDDEQVEIGTKLEVDGASKFNTSIEVGESGSVAHSTLLDVHGDQQVHGELMLDNLSHLQNPDGDSLIHVITKAEFEGGSFVYKINTVYIVYDTDGTCYVRYFVS